MNRAVAIGVLAAIAATAAGIVATSAGLPDRVATKFDFDGHAVGYASREGYAWLMGMLAVVVPLAGWASMALLPRRWPRLVNIPFRDYWLAPARREATLARLARLGAGLALLCTVVMVVVHVEVLEANRRTPPQSDPSLGLATMGIALAIVALAIGVTISFRRPKDAPP